MDQDALLFLKDYFTSLAAGIKPMVPAETSTQAHSETRVQGSSPQEGQPEGIETASIQEASGGGQGSPSEQQPIYFREFRFASEVPIWLDYQASTSPWTRWALSLASSVA